MSRPRLALEPKYGKLTVVSDLGGTHVRVRCDCDTEKWVLRTNLRAGRIKSCGQPGCRVYAAGQAPHSPAVNPQAPTWLPLDAIPGLYAKAQEPGATARLAAELSVPEPVINALLADIRRHGGLDNYMQFMSTGRPANPRSRSAAPSNPRAVAPGAVCAPPPVYTTER